MKHLLLALLFAASPAAAQLPALNSAKALFFQAELIYSNDYKTTSMLTAAAAISGKPMKEIGILFEQAKQVYSNDYRATAMLTAAASISGKPMAEIETLFERTKSIYNNDYQVTAVLTLAEANLKNPEE